MSYLPTQLLSSTSIGNIVGPTGGMQVFNTSNTGPYIYSSINNTTAFQNTGTQDQNYTSNPVWIPRFIGACQEVLYWTGVTSTNTGAWSSNGAISTWYNNGWTGVNSANSNGATLVFTCPNNPAVGVYWMEYLMAGTSTSGKFSLSYTANGGSAVNMRTNFDISNSNGTSGYAAFQLLSDYFTITSAGHSLVFTWTASQGAGGGYTLYISFIRLVLMQ